MENQECNSKLDSLPEDQKIKYIQQIIGKKEIMNQ